MRRPETRSPKRTLVAALAIGAAAVTAACGGEEAAPAAPSASPAPTPSSVAAQPARPGEEQQAVIGVIQKWQVAVDKGDGKTACALMHPNLQGVYAQDPGAEDCAGAIRNLHDNLGDARLANTRVFAGDVEIRGKRAVLSHVKIAEANDTKPDETEGFDMVKVDGTWLIEYVS
ncbi:MAG: hypothetical protein ACRDSE_11320 [Pseudonocardiaceae bacterium]